MELLRIIIAPVIGALIGVGMVIMVEKAKKDLREEIKEARWKSYQDLMSHVRMGHDKDVER